MDLLYFGNNERGIKILEYLHKSKHNIVGVVATENSNYYYWKNIISKALSLGYKENLFVEVNKEELRKLKPDLSIMCGYPKIIPQEVIDIAKKGTINLHASKVPDYRGASPLSWALINGEQKIGISILEVDEGIDTGRIYAQKVKEFSNDKTIKDVLEWTYEEYPKMLLYVMEGIENEILKPIEQPQRKEYSREGWLVIENEGSIYHKRKPEDSIIDFKNETDMEVHNKVRALTDPYPNAFYIENGKKIYVKKSKLLTTNYKGIAGRVVKEDDKGKIILCKNRGVRLM